MDFLGHALGISIYFTTLTYLIYTQMIETQSIYYVCNATAMWIRSSVGKRAVFTLFPIWHGFESYTNYNVFQVATIAFMFQI